MLRVSLDRWNAAHVFRETPTIYVEVDIFINEERVYTVGWYLSEQGQYEPTPGHVRTWLEPLLNDLCSERR